MRIFASGGEDDEEREEASARKSQTVPSEPEVYSDDDLVDSE